MGRGAKLDFTLSFIGGGGLVDHLVFKDSDLRRTSNNEINSVLSSLGSHHLDKLCKNNRKQCFNGRCITETLATVQAFDMRSETFS